MCFTFVDVDYHGGRRAKQQPQSQQASSASAQSDQIIPPKAGISWKEKVMMQRDIQKRAAASRNALMRQAAIERQKESRNAVQANITDGPLTAHLKYDIIISGGKNEQTAIVDFYRHACGIGGPVVRHQSGRGAGRTPRHRNTGLLQHPKLGQQPAAPKICGYAAGSEFCQPEQSQSVYPGSRFRIQTTYPGSDYYEIEVGEYP